MATKILATWFQLSLKRTAGHGGRRKGAGRKRHTDELPHAPRPLHKERFPVHVTLKIRRGIPSLRYDKRWFRIKRAFRYGCDKFGMRLCDFSVQSNHIHLIVEARDNQALARGVGALEIRIAKSLNRLLGRRGRVFVDRYHMRELRTPTEVKNAVHYVRYNWRHHGGDQGLPVDPFSSLSGEACWWDEEFTTVASPHTWLLRSSS